MTEETQLNSNPEVLVDWFDDFDGDNPYGFLSNFALGYPIHWQGHEFATSEQAFAYAKVDPSHQDAETWRGLLLGATDPQHAKSTGRLCPLRPDWEVLRYAIMRDIVWHKFTQHPDLGAALLATGQAYLQEGTYWNDRVWGVDLLSSNDPFKRQGWNMLGAILMETRARLLAQARWTA